MKGQIVQRGPMAVEVEAGKTYYWCSCGGSKRQPFCDGSHQGSTFAPNAYTTDKSGTVYFCACKQSDSPPLCDGSHTKIQL
jgi:CDGSH-type Zn-finger protein